MQRILLCVFLVIISVRHMTAQTQPQTPIIEEIDVQFLGPTTLSKQRVLDNLATKVGQPYNDRLVEEDIKSLYATGNVSNARMFAEPVTGGLKVTILLQGRVNVGEVLM